MKVLNLVYPEKSDIKFKISKFPDGQQNITILGNEYWEECGDFNLPQKYRPEIPKKPYKSILIMSRLNNFQDLELIICATKALRNLGVKEIHLYTPYFLGSRSDRKFEEGSNNYLKDVICPIINSLNFESVTVIDPHSFSLECCINNFKVSSIGQFGLFKWSVNRIYDDVLPKIGGELKDIEGKYILVSPDAGASKKIYKLAEQIGYTGDIITCSKDRDKDGKLTKTVVPVKDTGPLCKKDYIIVDDICDGGATFINIAKGLKKLYNCNHIYLIVTHGIFSKGFEELSKYFNSIYCTNSYREVDSHYEDDSDFGGKIISKDFVKQMNVF